MKSRRQYLTIPSPAVEIPTYFTDKSLIADTANIINWLWNFGEATAKKDSPLMLQNPDHQYKTDGDYLDSPDH